MLDFEEVQHINSVLLNHLCFFSSNRSLFQPKITDFLVEVLLFRFLYLWLTSSKFLYGEVWVKVVLFWLSSICWKAILKLSCHPLSKDQKDHISMGIVLDSVLLRWTASLLSPAPHYLDYCSFIASLTWEVPTLFFKKIFGCSRSSASPFEF